MSPVHRELGGYGAGSPSAVAFTTSVCSSSRQAKRRKRCYRTIRLSQHVGGFTITTLLSPRLPRFLVPDWPATRSPTSLTVAGRIHRRLQRFSHSNKDSQPAVLSVLSHSGSYPDVRKFRSAVPASDWCVRRGRASSSTSRWRKTRHLSSTLS